MAEDNWDFVDVAPPPFGGYMTVGEEVYALAQHYGCPPGVRAMDWLRAVLATHFASGAKNESAGN